MTNTKNKMTKILRFTVQLLIMSFLTIGLLTTASYLSAPDKDIILDQLKAEAISAVEQHNNSKTTLVFSEPDTTLSQRITKVEGHFVQTDKTTLKATDMLYTAAFIRTEAQNWKLVHLAINGKVKVHTLPE